MTKLTDWQLKAIDSYVEVCHFDENGVPGPLSGKEFDQFVKKLQSTEPWGELLTRWDCFHIVLLLLNGKKLGLPNEYVGLLKDAPDGFQIKASFRKVLAAFLESLPRPYYVYFPLVQMPSIGMAELVLSCDVAIIDTGISEGLEQKLVEPQNPLSRVLGLFGLNLKRDTRYVRLSISGYANTSPATPVAASAIAQIKHFLFVGLAKGVFVEVPAWQRIDSETPARDQVAILISHVGCDENERYVLPIPDDLKRFLLDIKIDSANLKYLDNSKGSTLLSFEERIPETPDEFAASVKLGFGRMVDFLAISREDPDAERIKAAIEWWIDAVASQNQTISFLQFCIGFEALLGDSGADAKRSRERGITERLADRFAYIRGHTQTERDNYRAEFTKVYERRGIIVHQRETHLRRGEDVDACQKARVMLFSAIADEVNSLMRTRRSV